MSVLSPICKVCGAPFHGIRGMIARLKGIQRNPKNPNICNQCAIGIEAGSLMEITTLFADCRGFTVLTEAVGAAKAAQIMDDLFKAGTDILVNHDAIVDHFMGDAVMAFFNAPIRHDDHQGRAVAAAIQLQMAMPSINARHEPPQPLALGIGIHTGWAMVGTIGSTNCKDYTAIGDSVNIAARLQAQAAPGEILVAEEVYQKVRSAFPNAKERVLELKGVKEPVKAYTLT